MDWNNDGKHDYKDVLLFCLFANAMKNNKKRMQNSGESKQTNGIKAVAIVFGLFLLLALIAFIICIAMLY